MNTGNFLVVRKKKINPFPSPLFMVAQLPFNTEEPVGLNTPMIEVMDDSGNVDVAISNLKELGVDKEVLGLKTEFLEIGCGSGYLLEYLYQHGKGKYFGLEPIGQECTKARHRLKPLLKKRKIKESLPSLLKNKILEKTSFGKQRFDFIYSYHVFEHIENPLTMFDFAKKHLKKNGRLIITCPNVEGCIPRMNLPRWRCAIPSHRWLPGKSTLTRSLEYNDFQVERCFTYGGYPAPRTWWQALGNKAFKRFDLGDIMCIMSTQKKSF